jgi:WhiB family redox-sensing transcriptional regulator
VCRACQAHHSRNRIRSEPKKPPKPAVPPGQDDPFEFSRHWWEPTPWMKDAACAGTTADFFPERGQTIKVQEAKQVCAGCPVRAECLDFALRWNILQGVWGGASGRDRRTMREQAS